ncbi:MAG: PDDEXK nuclease domain-containing protein [Verrucomicrobiales bacterium]|nr:PDDEXK nuclease domain-containing protein [Verrucomicrobiales bacterium]
MPPKKKTPRKTERSLVQGKDRSPESSDYAQLFGDLKRRIETSRVRAHLAVNRERTLLYYDIGQMISLRQKEEGWGSAVIPRLAVDLKASFPEIKGFSERNLKRMIAFFREYPALAEKVPQAVAQAFDPSATESLHQPTEKVPQPVALLLPALDHSVVQIPWGHNIVLIEKVKDLEARRFYAAKILENSWSRAVLVHQIESELHLRAGNQSNNFDLTLPDPQSDLARELIKDSFNLEFLDVRESIRERELEESLIKNLRDFLLELGTGFAFIGNQYRLEIGGQDYFLDLLFYHTHLHCHVVVELKIDAFKPEYAGKMQFYLAAVDDILKSERDASTIGILLCKEKNNIVVEYALRDASKPIAVADYTLKKTLPKELKGEIPSAAELKEGLKGD